MQFYDFFPYYSFTFGRPQDSMKAFASNYCFKNTTYYFSFHNSSTIKLEIYAYEPSYYFYEVFHILKKYFFKYYKDYHIFATGNKIHTQQIFFRGI